MPPGGGIEEVEFVSVEGQWAEIVEEALSAAATETSDRSKVVYDNPKPNSYCTDRLW